MVRDSNSGHQLLFPPANWSPIFAPRTTQDDVVPKTRTLFPGESCYPLSQTSDEADVDVEQFEEELMMDTHQLNVIFNLLGTPDADDMAQIESKVLRGCIQKFVAQHTKPPKGLASKYTAAPPDALELLSGMLHFNPKKRSDVRLPALHAGPAEHAGPVPREGTGWP